MNKKTTTKKSVSKWRDKSWLENEIKQAKAEIKEETIYLKDEQERLKALEERTDWLFNQRIRKEYFDDYDTTKRLIESSKENIKRLRHRVANLKLYLGDLGRC